MNDRLENRNKKLLPTFIAIFLFRRRCRFIRFNWEIEFILINKQSWNFICWMDALKHNIGYYAGNRCSATRVHHANENQLTPPHSQSKWISTTLCITIRQFINQASFHSVRYILCLCSRLAKPLSRFIVMFP